MCASDSQVAGGDDERSGPKVSPAIAMPRARAVLLEVQMARARPPMIPSASLTSGTGAARVLHLG